VDLAEETRLYQAALEELRRDPENEELQQIVAQQQQVMESAHMLIHRKKVYVDLGERRPDGTPRTSYERWPNGAPT
jgi:hypothetical protein